jgi:hypothetical protein
VTWGTTSEAISTPLMNDPETLNALSIPSLGRHSTVDQYQAYQANAFQDAMGGPLSGRMTGNPEVGLFESAVDCTD